MAKKEMKGLTQKELVSMDKGIHRGIMLDMGVYNVHKEKSHGDKSKYTRKQKHKGMGWGD